MLILMAIHTSLERVPVCRDSHESIPLARDRCAQQPSRKPTGPVECVDGSDIPGGVTNGHRLYFPRSFLPAGIDGGRSQRLDRPYIQATKRRRWRLFV